jgi:hypothetical protein
VEPIGRDLFAGTTLSSDQDRSINTCEIGNVIKRCIQCVTLSNNGLHRFHASIIGKKYTKVRFLSLL